MTGYTDPQGRRLPTAPPGWPFGTVKPPTPQQMLDDILRRAGEALL